MTKKKIAIVTLRPGLMVFENFRFTETLWWFSKVLLSKYFLKISLSLSGKSNETINREIEMDPGTLPQLTKMELLAMASNC